MRITRPLPTARLAKSLTKLWCMQHHTNCLWIREHARKKSCCTDDEIVNEHVNAKELDRDPYSIGQPEGRRREVPGPRALPRTSISPR